MNITKSSLAHAAVPVWGCGSELHRPPASPAINTAVSNGFKIDPESWTLLSRLQTMNFLTRLYEGFMAIRI